MPFKEYWFYGFGASLRFYTAKTHSGASRISEDRPVLPTDDTDALKPQDRPRLVNDDEREGLRAPSYVPGTVRARRRGRRPTIAE
jgi:hypothetical protein